MRKYIANILIEKDDEPGTREVLRDANLELDQRISVVILSMADNRPVVPDGWHVVAITLAERLLEPTEVVDSNGG